MWSFASVFSIAAAAAKPATSFVSRDSTVQHTRMSFLNPRTRIGVNPEGGDRFFVVAFLSACPREAMVAGCVHEGTLPLPFMYLVGIFSVQFCPRPRCYAFTLCFISFASWFRCTGPRSSASSAGEPLFPPPVLVEKGSRLRIDRYAIGHAHRACRNMIYYVAGSAI